MMLLICEEVTATEGGLVAEEELLEEGLTTRLVDDRGIEGSEAEAEVADESES